MESTKAPAAGATPTGHLSRMSKQPQKRAPTPRLTLEQIGKVLGTNAKARLPSEIQNVIFVAIDCEAYEFAQHKTTEIGVSILDAAMLANTPPGLGGTAWLEKINSEHFRIREFSHLINKRWVKGDPDAFSFGSSTWIGKSEAKDVLTKIFRPTEPGACRNIVLVGHGLKNEVTYLNNLQFDLMNAPNVVAIVDTQSIGPGKSQLGLKKLCQAMGMEPQSLHNAGNDAAYTLRAMVLATILHNSAPDAFKAALQPVMPVGRIPPTTKGTRRTQDRRSDHDRNQAGPKSQQMTPSSLSDRSLSQRPAKSKMDSHEERKARWAAKHHGGAAGSVAAGPTSKST